MKSTVPILSSALLLSGCFSPDKSFAGDGTGDDTSSTAESGSSGSGAGTSSSTSLGGTSESASTDSGPLDSGTSDSGATTSDGSASSSDTGNANCLVDGMIAANEQCDDANENAGDGCSNCMVEDGWGCANQPSLCFPACDPLLQDCAEGTGCYPLEPTWACAPDGSEGEGQQNEPCEFVNSCAPGLLCVIPEVFFKCVGMVGCCTTICDLNAPTCPGAFACQPYYVDMPAPPGLEGVGVCVA